MKALATPVSLLYNTRQVLSGIEELPASRAGKNACTDPKRTRIREGLA
jgi:hypothetical protein